MTLLVRSLPLPARAAARAAALAAMLAAVVGCGSGATPRCDPADEECAAELHPCGPLDDGKVHTNLGTIVGTQDGASCAFLGIPFADLGERWSQPSDPLPHAEPFDATRFGPACAQLSEADELVGSEDCLSLNVWNPGKGPERTLPTLVFFHGGGNVRGSSRQAVYRGAHLAFGAELVVVTVNYRLGPLGFFEFQAERGLPPFDAENFALRDQVRALRWIRHNIEHFGGDPNNVTVVGQSAGGRAVCALLSLQEQLFHRAAIHSAACEYEPYARAAAFAHEIADELDCDDIDCLRAAPLERVLKAKPSWPSMTQSSRHNVATRNPVEGFSQSVPLIVGSNADELLATAPELPTREAFVSLLATELGQPVAEAIGERYFQGERPPREAFAAALADARYHCHAERTAMLPGPPPSLRHRFLLDRPLDGDRQQPLGTYHGLDLIYLFGSFAEVGYEPSEGDRAFSRRFMELYGAFARTGQPAPAEAWPSHNGSGLTLLLGDVDAVAVRPRTEHCGFWEEIRGR